MSNTYLSLNKNTYYFYSRHHPNAKCSWIISFKFTILAFY